MKKAERVSKKALQRQLQETLTSFIGSLNVKQSKKVEKIIRKNSTKLAGNLKNILKPLPKVNQPEIAVNA